MGKSWHTGLVMISRIPPDQQRIFWVQFAAMWQRLADSYPAHREDYLEIARKCMAKAEAFGGEPSESEATQ